MPPARTTSPDGRERRLLIALFVIYLVLLTWTIMWKLAVPWIGAAAFLPHPIKLIPFFPSADADFSAPQEVLANVLFFVPFGIYLGLLAPRWRSWMAVGTFVGASLLLEMAQHVLSTGSFDITDIVANTAGGVAGLGLLALARRRLRSRVRPVLTRVLVVGTVVSLLAIAAFIASPLRYEPQHDVVFGQTADRPGMVRSREHPRDFGEEPVQALRPCHRGR